MCAPNYARLVFWLVFGEKSKYLGDKSNYLDDESKYRHILLSVEPSGFVGLLALCDKLFVWTPAYFSSKKIAILHWGTRSSPHPVPPDWNPPTRARFPQRRPRHRKYVSPCLLLLLRRRCGSAHDQERADGQELRPHVRRKEQDVRGAGPREVRGATPLQGGGGGGVLLYTPTVVFWP